MRWWWWCFYTFSSKRKEKKAYINWICISSHLIAQQKRELCKYVGSPPLPHYCRGDWGERLTFFLTAGIPVFFNQISLFWSHKKEKKSNFLLYFFQSHATLPGIGFKIKKIKKSGQIAPYLGQIAYTIGVFWPLLCLWKIHFLHILWKKLKFLILYWYVNG